MDGTIIILDYSSYERQKIKHILEKIGTFDVIEVSNSMQFKLLNLEIENLKLLIMDLAFPSEADGFDILKIVRSNKTAKDVPVIVVTRSDNLEYKTEALRYSVNDYIIKPFQVKRLESSVRSFVRLKDSFHYDTSGIGNIVLSFDEYVSREIKYAKRMSSPLSFILITTLKLKEDNDGYSPAEVKNKDIIFTIASQKARSSLRVTDTIVVSKTRDIIIVLPCTGESGAKLVCEKIKASIFQELIRINADFNDYIYPVYVTFPKEGDDFQMLMENAFKKVSEKEMLEKIVSISPDTRKYANSSYNQFRKWL
jgi:Response regulator containing a CheY-like receiver domain and a GGDEF domain